MKRQSMSRRMEGLKGEVRRVHVLYYLSHNGTIEQPHLIRVHHLHRNGVYLRDVKRWLADLRGKDMPDSFSWSYKRRYKSGYVWQDLMDDELITPISDNEYVLKGSELSSKTDFPLDEISSEEEGGAKQAPAPKTSPESLHLEIDKSASRKTLPEADQECSPGAEPPPPLSGSDVSDDSAKRASISKADIWKQQLELNKNEDASFVSSIRNESCSNRVHLRPGHRMSSLFHNLFRCQRVDTKDTTLLTTVQRVKRYQSAI